MKLRLLLCCVLFSCLAPAAVSQVIDADIRPGDAFDGRIENTADVDVVRFEALAETVLTIKAIGVKDKELKGNPNLLPRVEVFDLTTGDPVADETSGKKVTAVKKLVLPSSGLYLVRVSGTEDTFGPFKLRTKGKLGKAGRVFDAAEQVLAGGSLDVVFDAQPGFVMNATVRPDKKSPARPAAPTLASPSGPQDITAATVTNEAKASHKVKKVDLDEMGTYTLSTVNGVTEGELAEDGSIKIRVKLKPVKIQKQQLVEPTDESGVSSARTLSGTVLNSNTDAGLPGVTISIAGEDLAVTDGSGNFIVHDPPVGMVAVDVDGATSPAVGSFPHLEMVADVSAVGETRFAALTLTDLDDPDTASDTVAVDGAGTTTEPIAAAGIDPDIQLAGPIGTTILVNGVAPTQPVELSVTPVDPSNVPMPLNPPSGAVDASSYVTIQPGGASFDNNAEGGASGLDIVLPNNRDFPVGTLVDIWSFDHDAGDWVNRSTETGQQGIVAPGGTQIVASGVITKGGWHAPAIAINAACATKITGRVVDSFGQPIPGTSVSTTTGQFAVTGADGTFCVVSVPAYDAFTLPACNPPIDPIGVDVRTPVSYGAVAGNVVVPNNTLVAGGTTDAGDIVVTIPLTGSLSGLLVDNGVAVQDFITLDQAEGAIQTGANGSFFVTGLTPGSYTASYQFPGDLEPTPVDFVISANQLTTVTLQRVLGGGNETITVVMLVRETSTSPVVPVEAGKITLVGTDGSSSAGITGMTDANGEVVFNNVSGPYTVTGQMDVVEGGGAEGFAPTSARIARTLVDITPPTGTIGLFLDLDFDEDEQATFDSRVQGTVSNMPVFGQFEFLDVRVSGTNFTNFGQVNPVTGFYSVDVQSGQPLFVTLTHQEGTQGGNNPLSIMFATDVGPVAPAAELIQDFDMGSADLIPFNRAVDITYTNTLGVAGFQALELLLWLPNGNDEGFGGFFFGEGAPPTSIMLPDADHPALAAYRMSVIFEQESAQGIDDGTSCDVFLDDNPTQLDFVLSDVPEVTSPGPEAVVTVEQAAGLTVTFVQGSPKGGAGLNCVAIESNNELFNEGGLGVDEVIWSLWLPADRTSVTLPPSAVPMFAAGTNYLICIEENRVEGVAFDLNDLVDENVVANIAAIDAAATGLCETYAVSTFSTDL